MTQQTAGNGSGPTWKWLVGILVSLVILVAGAYGQTVVSQVDENSHRIQAMERLLERIDEKLDALIKRVDAISSVTQGGMP